MGTWNQIIPATMADLYDYREQVWGQLTDKGKLLKVEMKDGRFEHARILKLRNTRVAHLGLLPRHADGRINERITDEKGVTGEICIACFVNGKTVEIDFEDTLREVPYGVVFGVDDAQTVNVRSTTNRDYKSFMFHSEKPEEFTAMYGYVVLPGPAQSWRDDWFQIYGCVTNELFHETVKVEARMRNEYGRPIETCWVDKVLEPMHVHTRLGLETAHIQRWPHRVSPMEYLYSKYPKDRL